MDIRIDKEDVRDGNALPYAQLHMGPRWAGRKQDLHTVNHSLRGNDSDSMVSHHRHRTLCLGRVSVERCEYIVSKASAEESLHDTYGN